ncbi:MAG: hypothetical protein WCP10_16035, partial [Desulfuromonadales bacterium]
MLGRIATVAVTVTALFGPHLACSLAEAGQSFDLDVDEIKNISALRAAPPAKPAPPVPKATGAQKIRPKRLASPPRPQAAKPAIEPHTAQFPEIRKPAIVNPEPLVEIKTSAAPFSKNKLLLLRRLPTPETIPAPIASATFTIQRSLSSCELVSKALAILATPIPAAEALHGIPLAAPYAARRDKIVAVFACGLAKAEEKQFAKKLAPFGTKLLNIAGDDSPESVVQKVADSFGLTSQLIRSTPQQSRIIYIFPVNVVKDTGMFIVLTNETP